MTTLNMSALTPRQRDVLSAIAVSEDGGHHPKVLKALEAKGLIEAYRETLPGTYPVVVTRWAVPTHIHIQWAAWCAEQPDEEMPS